MDQETPQKTPYDEVVAAAQAFVEYADEKYRTLNLALTAVTEALQAQQESINKQRKNWVGFLSPEVWRANFNLGRATLKAAGVVVVEAPGIYMAHKRFNRVAGIPLSVRDARRIAESEKTD